MEMFSAFWNILPLTSSMLTQENTDSPSVQLNLVWAFLFYAFIEWWFVFSLSIFTSHLIIGIDPKHGSREILANQDGYGTTGEIIL